MKPSTLLTLFALFAIASPLLAQTGDRWLLPDPDEMVKASNTLCADQGRSALLAWQYRANGKTKEEVLALLPESPKGLALRVASAMRENVEDAFAYPDLSQYALYMFRSEACFRETLGAVRVPRLATVIEPVRDCQRIHGPEKSLALSRCIQANVRSLKL